MIKIIIAAGLLLFASCSGSAEHEHNAESETSVDAPHQHATRNDVEAPDKKWQLDESTRSNIANIKGLLQGPSSGKDLGQLGDKLQYETDKLISECRMDGPDHDALHVWLEDYLQHLKALKNSSGNREKAYAELQEDMVDMDTDFQ